MVYRQIDSPLGPLRIAGDDAGLRRIDFVSNRPSEDPPPDWREDAQALYEPARQLVAYFRGELRRFELELAPRGTAFQRAVWRELLNIPYGETISYGELARRIGRIGASRAVGGANGRNPIPVVIPCHRVIGSSGSLTGYGGGLPIKRLLLELERETRGGTFAWAKGAQTQAIRP